MNKQAQNLVSLLIQRVKSDDDILGVILFGSHVADSGMKPNDVDVCLVVCSDGNGINRLSEMRLKYLKEFDLDITLFQQLPLYVRQRVLRDGQVLYCRDEDQLYELAFKTIRELSSFEHVYRFYLNEVAHAG